MTLDMFGHDQHSTPAKEPLGAQAHVLRAFALPFVDTLVPVLAAIEEQAGFRHLVTPGGHTMSVALTNCGTTGWTSDQHGYRYAAQDPQTGQPWPAMPAVFLQLAQAAAREAGFEGFMPNACLINRYVPGAKLTLHQDKDELDLMAPIVSVSLGIPAIFLFGGHLRTDHTVRIPLFHGDVVVWGGVDRLRFHGVMPIKDACHSLFGAQRINFTFRQTGIR